MISTFCSTRNCFSTRVWAVAGLGLFAVLLGAAAATAWLHVPAGDPVNRRRTGAPGHWPGTLGAG